MARNLKSNHVDVTAEFRKQSKDPNPIQIEYKGNHRRGVTQQWMDRSICKNEVPWILHA